MFKELTFKSGGAEGSDHYWTKVATDYGVTDIRNYYVEGYGRLAPYGDTEISYEQSKEADEELKALSKFIGRKFPTKSEEGNTLLRRDWFQAQDTDLVLAVGYLDDEGWIKGGTAWASYTAIKRGVPFCFFDQDKNRWLFVDGAYYELSDPSLNNAGVVMQFAPTLDKVKTFTGIGSRSLTEMGKLAIKEVFRKTQYNFENLDKNQ